MLKIQIQNKSIFFFLIEKGQLISTINNKNNKKEEMAMQGKRAIQNQKRYRSSFLLNFVMVLVTNI